ncbi:MAG: recombinase RecA [Acetomicrobium sp.]|jgi:recombination protein RecA|uniref:recombinase RecA n=1 Tax=Acetomicrobium TaxID=49894 RepID=UPI0016ABCBFE|nr:MULTISPECIES: recombinase RecA [Acetomicrobium]MDI9377227.1 recombinase RecA [Synergistota bacterium]MDR9769673.1 recombinase RecA [Acetomicrobium sp.]NLI42099.1 recombinase RecA [Synergistaceae bacterium]HQC88627.1 recombinase RecA [Acetomicrobium sp.]
MAKKENPKTREDILQQAISDIKSKFGDGAIMRLGDGGVSPVEVIPTGILPLDVALGIGGLPRGRIIEIFGPEGSGKTTLALHPLAEAQKMGGVAAFIDAEHALDPSLAISVGVDAKSLFISQPDSGEQALYILDSLVRSGAVDIIVIDSVAALTPQAEIDGKIGETQVGLQARLMSYALRRLASSISKSKCIVVFINQLRAKIGMSGYGGAQETTTGGRALKFYSSVRIEVRRGKSITRGDSIIGHELWIKVVKNKQAPPFRTAHASLIYGKGIPKAMAVLDMAIDMDVVKKKGSWLAYKGETLGQGKEKVTQLLEEQPELMEEISREVMGIVAETSGLVNLLPPKSFEDEDTEDRDEDEAMERALLGEEDVLELDVESAD